MYKINPQSCSASYGSLVLLSSVSTSMVGGFLFVGDKDMIVPKEGENSPVLYLNKIFDGILVKLGVKEQSKKTGSFTDNFTAFFTPIDNF